MFIADFEDNRITLAILLVIMSLTDIADGYTARKFNKISELGKIIDPVADKLCIGIIALLVLAKGLIPLWFVAVVISRDLLILTFGLMLAGKYKITLMSNYTGKITALLIGIILLLSIIKVELLNEVNSYLIYLTTILIIYSLIVYFKRFLKTIGDKKNEK
jgi:CDP-diacylglycerol--glycerol-3-phosphate 3-phosphatidyltransferase